MRHITLPLTLAFGILVANAQSIMITFEATENGTATPLDSIRVMNLTQGGDTTIVFPANTLVLGSTGVREAQAAATRIQGWPNPFSSATDIMVDAGALGELVLTVHDATGREVAIQRVMAQPGGHRFRFTAAAAGVHVVSALHNGQRITLRMIATGEGGASGAQLIHLGATELPFNTKSNRAAFTWEPGDELRYIGYAFPGNFLNSDAIDEVPVTSATRTFILQRGAVCPETPTTTDIDGNSYRAVQIGEQCWTAGEMRTGRFANGDVIANVQDDADWIAVGIAAWCNYNNDAVNEVSLGRLYNWYVVSDPRNVCPAGWHVPSDAEWMELETAMGMPANQLAVIGVRGAVEGVGGKLKANYLWTPLNPNNINLFGFAALPTGRRLGDTGVFADQTQVGYWWTATPDNDGLPFMRTMHFGSMGVARSAVVEGFGYGIRCVRD